MQIRTRNTSLVRRSITKLFQRLAGSGSKAKKRKELLAVWVKVSPLVIPYPLQDRFLTCLGQKQVKLYTLFRTARPKNHTLSSGTSPYSPNKGVPPPPRERSISSSPSPFFVFARRISGLKNEKQTCLCDFL